LTYEDVEYIPRLDDVLTHTWTERDSMQAVTAVQDIDQVGLLIGKFRKALGTYTTDKEYVRSLGHSILEVTENLPLHGSPKICLMRAAGYSFRA
jgi:hypothetical protein